MIFEKDAIEDLKTMGDLVRWGASRFAEAGLSYGHGIDNALDESFNLVRHTLHLPHEIPPYMINTRLTKAERRTAVSLLVERISTRKPAAYLTGEAWFAGIPFFVDERVLVPRSPIAELIETGFEPWTNPDNVRTILDLCTGGGCIAIACAMAFPDASVDAIDLSVDALDVARINIERHDLLKQVRTIKSDVFSALAGASQGKEKRQYDLIVSNPPYVDARDMAALTPEFEHEPAMALQAGNDGLDIVKRILKEATDYLTEDGLLVVEVGNSYLALVKQFPTVPFAWPEFERGGQGVFVISASQLRACRDQFQAC